MPFACFGNASTMTTPAPPQGGEMEARFSRTHCAIAHKHSAFAAAT